MIVHTNFIVCGALAGLLTVACGKQPQEQPAVAEPVSPPPPVEQAAKPGPPGEAPADVPSRGPSPVCDAVLGSAARALLAPEPATDPTWIHDPALARLVSAHDTAFSRKDGEKLQALDASQSDAYLHAHEILLTSIIHGFRGHLGQAAELERTPEDRMQAWEDAACLWDLALVELARQIPQTPDDAAIAEEVARAFADGRSGSGDQNDVDALNLAVLPARQRIEKRLYRVLHRTIVAAVQAAHTGPEPARAHELQRARRVLGYLADRIETKNTPGLVYLHQSFERLPPPTHEQFRHELNIAFAKRTRKYCSDAVDHPERTLALRLASAAEGATYMRVILPDMAQLLEEDGFDVDAYQDTWERFEQELAANPEADFTTIRDELVRWNCAYQLKLGIAECTSTKDELARPG